MDCSNEGVALGELSVVEALAAAFACLRLSVRACFCSFLSCDFDNLGGSVLFARWVHRYLSAREGLTCLTTAGRVLLEQAPLQSPPGPRQQGLQRRTWSQIDQRMASTRLVCS
jgi:hypothetical protein